MLRTGLLVLALSVFPLAILHAAEPQKGEAPLLAMQPESPPLGHTDLISLGAGYADFDKDEPRTRSADFRGEYRWGYSLFGTNNDWLNFNIHPIAGAEVSTRSQLYGFGGLAFDLLFWKHVVFTESEAVGLWDSGDAKPLGSTIEFRSQAELGWRFDNDLRLTAQISHISNAGMTRRNPGEEIAGAYVHIPVAMLFGR